MNFKKISISHLVILLVFMNSCWSQPGDLAELHIELESNLITGAEQTELYFPLLKDKKIGIVANHSTLIESVHLVDSLVSSGFNVVKIFGPEHGFRGLASDGELVVDQIDIKTGIPIISLYGSNKKPSEQNLGSIDLMIFDIQDVGVRFYTFISTMTYMMEACATSGIPLIILDRPNPNGFYVDGPVLEKGFESFIGLHPVPIVYGITIGEYALMVNGERWLSEGLQCDVKIIPLKNYDRGKSYELPVNPSPNLPNWKAVYLYPSRALFEGTIISVGRGTNLQFQVIGHPDFKIGSFIFQPKSMPGAKYPKHEGEVCFGLAVRGFAENMSQNQVHFTLQYLIGMYDYFKDKEVEFFTSYFDKLAGTSKLRDQITSGINEAVIRESWQEDLSHFNQIREKYLIYVE